MSVQILEHEGKAVFALMPIEEDRRLVTALEDAPDAATVEALYRRLVSGEEETFPAEVADRLLAGEHPVRVFRSHRGMTLQQVADACGVTNSHISQIENGKRSMSTELLKKVAEALRVDPELLL
ncbi:helix-turn-helix domain-containing protein [Desulfosoma sp.]